MIQPTMREGFTGAEKNSPLSVIKAFAAVRAAFFCLAVLPGWTSLCPAAEQIEWVDELQSDAKDSRSLSKAVVGEEASFVPVPIPISNPTIGSGLAMALLYLHPSKGEKSSGLTTTTGVVGMYTNTDSWAGAGFHDGYYRYDTIRFRAAAGYGILNLDFYGIGSDSLLQDNPIDFQADSFGLVSRLLHRLPSVENWFFGAEYVLLRLDTKFDLLGSFLTNAPGIEASTQTAGLGAVAVYDARDSNSWPSRGSWLELKVADYREIFGGDFDYWKLGVKWAQYFPLSNPVTFVYRIDGQMVDGDAPFYDLPRVRLRGYSSMQLLDNYAVSIQGEVRWNFFKRWTALAFGGVGRIAENFDDLWSADNKPAGGVGLRYMLVEKQKLNIGVDFAFAEGEMAFYVQVGDWLAN